MKWHLILFITILSLPVQAQNLCGSYDRLAAELKRMYNEQVTHSGYIENAAHEISIVEIWETEDSDTFSIVLIRPNGIACLIITGKELRWNKDAFNDET